MAHKAWEMEAEVDPFAGRRSRGRRFMRVFAALLSIGVVTFVLAYYVPLLRAHRLLTQMYQRTAEQTRTAEQSLTQARSDLKAATEKRERLEAERAQRETTEASGRKRVDQLLGDLSSKLGRSVDKGLVALSSADGRVRAAIPEDALFPPGKKEMSASGQKLVCEVAKAAGAGPLRAVAMAGPTTPWEDAAAQSAAVVRVLGDKCAVPVFRLEATVRTAGAAAKPTVGIEIAAE